MAGHSKWANTKHRKARQDAQKGKIFTKLSRAITVAAREGGGDLDRNFSLRLAVQKAREANMPNDNIMRSIKRGTGGLEDVSYDHALYEGYGPVGVALLIEILTDNRNRTAPEIRNIFSRNGGSLGESGCVAWMFQRRGYISILPSENDNEDQLMLTALEAGADDFKPEGGTYAVITEPEELEEIKDKLILEGVKINTAEVTMLPENVVEITDPGEAAKVLKLMEALADHDDVQNVYANFDIAEEIMDQV
jgi:YebC/PmpR family DNA-binding regulatory protein